MDFNCSIRLIGDNHLQPLSSYGLLQGSTMLWPSQGSFMGSVQRALASSWHKHSHCNNFVTEVPHVGTHLGSEILAPSLKEHDHPQHREELLIANLRVAAPIAKFRPGSQQSFANMSRPCKGLVSPRPSFDQRSSSCTPHRRPRSRYTWLPVCCPVPGLHCSERKRQRDLLGLGVGWRPNAWIEVCLLGWTKQKAKAFTSIASR